MLKDLEAVLPNFHKAQALIHGISYLSLEPNRNCADFCNAIVKVIYKDKIKNESHKSALVDSLVKLMTPKEVYQKESEEFYTNSMMDNYRFIDEELGKHKKPKPAAIAVKQFISLSKLEF